MWFILLQLFSFNANGIQSAGILYPRISETREVLSLDGIWDFTLDNTKNWHNVNFNSELDTELMAVPASYNDIGTNSEFRDHVGLVWYQRNFIVPYSWKESKRVFIRFSSVCYAAEVWINDVSVVTHKIGHLPFQAEITDLVNYEGENSITVVVDNTLNDTTIPQGSLSTLESGRVKQSYTFDFFNYAGIDRPVVLYTTPGTYIDDISISTDIDGTNGHVSYSVKVEGPDAVTPQINLLDKNGNEVATDLNLEGTLIVQNATFWWPYLMDPNPGYLYTLQVNLLDASGNLFDKYTLPVGIRTITWDSISMSINNKPIYLRGFGRHEDSDIRGKGLDLPVIIRDHNLIKWIGANSYRTSHYPYAEEILDLADSLGIMIIDECPGVNIENFSEELLENHKQSLSELIQRDKNRPSVIMWSAANEPRTQYPSAKDYFKQVVEHIKTLDTSRPVTIVNDQKPNVEYSGEFIDIASTNIYYGWYHETGDLDDLVWRIVDLGKQWHEKHNIPVLVTEYGADTLEGLHLLPSFVWSEEYQNDLMSKHFEAFDILRQEGYFIGEMIWNFADFKTSQTYTRVGGNKKGVFTRNREPKASAHLLRKRYWALGNVLDQVELPDDLNEYIIGDGVGKSDPLNNYCPSQN